jgi:NitT/TauT family transport system permease protein
MPARLFRNLAAPVLILGVWQLLSYLGLIKPVILPSPVAVVERFGLYLWPAQLLSESAGISDWVWSSELLGDLVASLRRVMLGFGVGAGLALPLGLMMGTDRRIEGFLNPSNSCDLYRRSPTYPWQFSGLASAIRLPSFSLRSVHSSRF